MAQKSQCDQKSPSRARPAPEARKHVYFFGNGKADGNRTMKDLLGGKGSGLAEMTNAGLPVPPGFTISTDVCTIYYKEKGKIPPAIDREIDEQRPQAREGRRRDARLDRQPAAGVGPLRREVLDARHDGHDPQPRPERRGGRGLEATDAERPLRVRQLPPLHPDVRQRRARDPEGRVRARVRGREEGAAREARHRARRERAARGRRPLQGGRAASGPAARFPRTRPSS